MLIKYKTKFIKTQKAKNQHFFNIQKSTTSRDKKGSKKRVQKAVTVGK